MIKHVKLMMLYIKHSFSSSLQKRCSFLSFFPHLFNKPNKRNEIISLFQSCHSTVFQVVHVIKYSCDETETNDTTLPKVHA